jgi:hypothetical protein
MPENGGVKDMSLARPFRVQRSPRVRLVGSVLALVQLNDGQHVRGRLHQLSANGGVLQVPDALGSGTPIQLIFHVRSTTLHTSAEMLDPMWSTSGNLQPFRFTSLSEQERGSLTKDIGTLLHNARLRAYQANAFRRFS